MSKSAIPAVRPNSFQRSFVVDIDADAVWESITSDVSTHADGQNQYYVAGFEAVCSEIETEPGKFLRLKKEEEPCKGTEVIIGLELEGSGTRVTVVQSGFGDWLPDVFEMFGYVWNWIVADLMLFIERGVHIKTHLFDTSSPTVSLGCTTNEHLTGLIVASVEEDGFCNRAGLKEGDLLLKLNSVRLVNGMLLGSLLKMAKTGDEVDVVYARDRELQSVTARL